MRIFIHHIVNVLSGPIIVTLLIHLSRNVSSLFILHTLALKMRQGESNNNVHIGYQMKFFSPRIGLVLPLMYRKAKPEHVFKSVIVSQSLTHGRELLLSAGTRPQLTVKSHYRIFHVAMNLFFITFPTCWYDHYVYCGFHKTSRALNHEDTILDQKIPINAYLSST